MRRLLSALVALVSLVLAAVAVPTIWLDRNIVQEDGFVAIAAPLGSDKQFQDALASATSRAVLSGSKLDQNIQSMAQPVVESLAKSITTLPGYQAAWAETLRRSHRLTVADPATLPPEYDAASSLTLDVAPLVALVTDKLSSTVGVKIPAPQQTLINVGQPNQRQAIERLTAYAPLAYWLAGGAVVAFLLALVLARRRGTMLALYGIGVALVAGAWKLAEGAATRFVQGTASGSQVADLFKRQFVDASAANFDGWIGAGFVVAGVLVVVGVILRIFARR